VKYRLRKPFLPVLAALVFQKSFFFRLPSMSMNGLGRAAKRFACLRTSSPDIRPNGAPDTAVWRYPAPLLPHPYHRFTCDRALHLHVRNLFRVRIRSTMHERPAFSCQGGLSGITQRQDPLYVFGSSDIPTGEFCRRSRQPLYPGLRSLSLRPGVVLYVYFQLLCSEVPQEYLRYPTVTSPMTNYECMTVGLGHPSIRLGV
jgi:hypothetical protein